jgi:hypothetical protein
MLPAAPSSSVDSTSVTGCIETIMWAGASACLQTLGTMPAQALRPRRSARLLLGSKVRDSNWNSTSGRVDRIRPIGDCCTAGVRSGLCRSWVNRVRDGRRTGAARVRIAPKADIVWFHSGRQLFANAVIAASRLGA